MLAFLHFLLRRLIVSEFFYMVFWLSTWNKVVGYHNKQHVSKYALLN